MKYFCLLIYFLSLDIWSAPNPTRHRFEFSFGKYNLSYQEEKDFGAGVRDPEAQTQEALHGNFMWQYAFLPPYVTLTMDMDSTSNVSATTSNGVTAVNLFETAFKVHFLLPLIFNERLGLGFTSSYNVLYNFQRTEDFTMQYNLTFLGYPEIVFFPTGFEEDYNLSFYANYSVVNVRTERQDATFGMRLFFPFYGKRIKYPLYAYQTGIVIRLEYNETSIITSQGVDQNFEFTISRFMGSIGLSF